LYKRGAPEDDSCKYCREEETVDHIIYSCKLYEDLRKQDLTISELLKSEMIESEQNYNKFLQFAKDVFNKRETYRETVDSRN